MTSALELRRVSKVYGSGPTEVNALTAVDLAVERGELVADVPVQRAAASTSRSGAGIRRSTRPGRSSCPPPHCSRSPSSR